MLVGSAHVSTIDQNPVLQVSGLKAAGCERIFTEKASGAQREQLEFQSRPQLRAQLK